eukprot:g5329.t1
MVVFNSTMWLTGGETSGTQLQRYRDVWQAEFDGRPEFRLVEENAPWSERAFHSFVVHPLMNGTDAMWVLGGGSQNGGCTPVCKDIWYTTNGVVWIQAFPKSTFWSGRLGHRSLSYNGKLWVFGGLIWSDENVGYEAKVIPAGDLWVSSNPTNVWTQVDSPLTKENICSKKSHKIGCHGWLGHQMLTFNTAVIAPTSKTLKIVAEEENDLLQNEWKEAENDAGDNEPSPSPSPPIPVVHLSENRVWLIGGELPCSGQRAGSNRRVVGEETEKPQSDVKSFDSKIDKNDTIVQWANSTTTPGWEGRIFHTVEVLQQDPLQSDQQSSMNDGNIMLLAGGSLGDLDLLEISRLWRMRPMPRLVWSEANSHTLRPSNEVWTWVPSIAPSAVSLISVVPNEGEYDGDDTDDGSEGRSPPSSTNWIQQEDAPWDARTGHAMVSFEGKIFVMGGIGADQSPFSPDENLFKDLWCLGCGQIDTPPPSAWQNAAMGVAVTFFATVAGLIAWVYFRPAKGERRRDSIDQFLGGSGGLGVDLGLGTGLLEDSEEKDELKHALMRAHSANQWALDWNAVKLESEIARGSAGWVYKGKYAGTEVAIKQLRISSWDDHLSKRSIYREVGILAALRHPNVVRMYGVVLRSPYVYIVMEYCPANLTALLHDPAGRRDLVLLNENGEGNRKEDTSAGLSAGAGYSREQLLSISHEIASGMAFLHSRKVLHRDLKPDNILLDSSLRVHICDFGVSRLLGGGAKGAATQATVQAGSPLFMAPEIMSSWKTECSPPVDVYAFGILFLMIMSFQPEPYKNSELNNVLPLRFMKAVCEGMRPPIPKDSLTEKEIEICKECWAGEPSLRPDFPEIQQRIADIKAKLKV